MVKLEDNRKEESADAVEEQGVALSVEDGVKSVVERVDAESVTGELDDEFEDDDQDPEGDLYEHHKIVVDPGQSPLRVDRFLVNRIQGVSRNRIQNAAEKGNVLANGSSVKSNYKVRPNDVISVMMPYPKHEFELIPQDLSLDIIYEDDDLLIVDKEAGMVVHPGHGNYSGTLVNGLIYYLQDLEMFQEGDTRAGLVHRLDKDTSGLLVVAKSEEALTHLAKQFFDRTVKRRYVALVWGDFEEDEGTIIGNIGRSSHDRTVMAVYEDESEGKHAVTHYKVLERFGYATLVECRLETGRTHQIRVHMAWQGHPLFNDARYGGDRVLRGQSFSKYKQFVDNNFKIIPRQALHARSLGFIHPTTGEEVTFVSKLPADMEEVVERWRNYAKFQDTF